MTLIETRERAARRALKLLGCRLQKTPPRHWTRAEFGTGYMVMDDRNRVIGGAAVREYDWALDDVEKYVATLKPTYALTQAEWDDVIDTHRRTRPEEVKLLADMEKAREIAWPFWREHPDWTLGKCLDAAVAKGLN